MNSASASSCVETFRTRVEHGVIFLELADNYRKGQEDGMQESAGGLRGNGRDCNCNRVTSWHVMLAQCSQAMRQSRK